MALTNEDATVLAQQVQESHRLLAAFYERLLSVFDNAATDFDCRFQRWRPTITDLPSRQGTQPSSKWAWDYLPMYASEHHYLRRDGAADGSLALGFRLWTDRHFSGIDRSRLGVKGEPDPVSLPRGPAEIHVRLIRGTASETEDFPERVRLTDWPLPGDWSALGNGLQVRTAVVPLAAVIADQDGLPAAIRQLLNT